MTCCRVSPAVALSARQLRAAGLYLHMRLLLLRQTPSTCSTPLHCLPSSSPSSSSSRAQTFCTALVILVRPLPLRLCTDARAALQSPARLRHSCRPPTRLQGQGKAHILSLPCPAGSAQDNSWPAPAVSPRVASPRSRLGQPQAPASSSARPAGQVSCPSALQAQGGLLHVTATPSSIQRCLCVRFWPHCRLL